jgi:D-inositol-3-phosphate glycosyltransferase
MTEDLKLAAGNKLAPGSFHFPGFVPSKSTVPFYLAATMAVFPSRYDTWSRAVNEAMIAGRPCIVSTRVAAAGGLVEDGVNGYVVEGLDPRAYAERIACHLSLSPEQRREMGEAARARALEFSYEAHVDDLYRSLTDVARAKL